MYRTNMEKNQGMLFIFDEESVLTLQITLHRFNFYKWS